MCLTLTVPDIKWDFRLATQSRFGNMFPHYLFEHVDSIVNLTLTIRWPWTMFLLLSTVLNYMSAKEYERSSMFCCTTETVAFQVSTTIMFTQCLSFTPHVTRLYHVGNSLCIWLQVMRCYPRTYTGVRYTFTITYYLHNYFFSILR